MVKFRVVIDKEHGGLELTERGALQLAERIAFEEGVASRIERVTDDCDECGGSGLVVNQYEPDPAIDQQMGESVKVLERCKVCGSTGVKSQLIAMVDDRGQVARVKS